MNFENLKKKELKKIKKEKIDLKIRSLIRTINSFNDYVTTSSCSGRTGLLMLGKKKCDMGFVYKTHCKIKRKKEVWKKVKPKGDAVLFFFEGANATVCCRDEMSAIRLIKTAHECGWDHSKVWKSDSHCIVELGPNDVIEVPLAKYEMIMSKEGFSFLCEQANSGLERSHRILKEFENELKLMK